MKISKNIRYYFHSCFAAESSLQSSELLKKTAGPVPACLLALLLAVVFQPEALRGCACGCGIFEVGSSAMFPSGPGGMLSLEYDYQDQNQNWHNSSQAPAGNNEDKELRTHFVTLGLQYMFDRSWGIRVEVPFANRLFKTGDEPVAQDWNSPGDIRITGIYTGFSTDMSTGIECGIKLPTGDYGHNDSAGDIDRDSEIGTGSTDFLVGAFHRGNLTADSRWSWFTQIQADLPAFVHGGYRPGFEINGALGIQFNGWSLGRAKCIPMLQAIASERTRDTGPASASPVASGYQRVLIAPGVEFEVHPVKVYADIEIPVFEHVTGNQLVAPVLFKVSVGCMF